MRDHNASEWREKMINKLISKIQKTNAPIVVGLDPMMKFVPEHIKAKAFAEFGETLEGAAELVGPNIVTAEGNVGLIVSHKLIACARTAYCVHRELFAHFIEFFFP